MNSQNNPPITPNQSRLQANYAKIEAEAKEKAPLYTTKLAHAIEDQFENWHFKKKDAKPASSNGKDTFSIDKATIGAVAIASVGSLASASSVWTYSNVLTGPDASLFLKIPVTLAAGVPTTTLSFIANFSMWGTIFRLRPKEITKEDYKAIRVPAFVTLLSTPGSFKVNWKAWQNYGYDTQMSLGLMRAVLSSVGNNGLFAKKQWQKIFGDHPWAPIKLIKEAKTTLTLLAEDEIQRQRQNYQITKLTPNNSNAEYIKYNKDAKHHFINLLEDSHLFQTLAELKLHPNANPDDLKKIIDSIMWSLVIIVAKGNNHEETPTHTPQELNAIHEEEKATPDDTPEPTIHAQEIQTLLPTTDSTHEEEGIEALTEEDTQDREFITNVATFIAFLSNFALYYEAGNGVLPLILSNDTPAQFKSNSPFIYYVGGLPFSLSSGTVNGCIAAISMASTMAAFWNIYDEGLSEHFKKYDSKDWKLLCFRVFFIVGYGLTNAGMAFKFPPIFDNFFVCLFAALLSLGCNLAIGSLSINTGIAKVENLSRRSLLTNAIDYARSKATSHHVKPIEDAKEHAPLLSEAKDIEAQNDEATPLKDYYENEKPEVRKYQPLSDLDRAFFVRMLNDHLQYPLNEMIDFFNQTSPIIFNKILSTEIKTILDITYPPEKKEDKNAHPNTANPLNNSAGITLSGSGANVELQGAHIKHLKLTPGEHVKPGKDPLPTAFHVTGGAYHTPSGRRSSHVPHSDNPYGLHQRRGQPENRRNSDQKDSAGHTPTSSTTIPQNSGARFK